MTTVWRRLGGLWRHVRTICQLQWLASVRIIENGLMGVKANPVMFVWSQVTKETGGKKRKKKTNPIMSGIILT